MSCFTRKRRIGLVFLVLCLLLFVLTGCGKSSDLRPVVFVHGFYGSASQFESQIQRFIANGYPVEYLAVYDHDTSVEVEDLQKSIIDRLPITNAALNEIIDHLLEISGADKVDLVGHSRGCTVTQMYLETPAHREKVAHYVRIDGGPMDAAPEGVETLAIWADGVLGRLVGWDPDAREIAGAKNVYLEDQAHIEACTSPESFAEMYRFFNDRDPKTTEIPEARGNTVKIAGAVNYFPENVGAIGTLEIYEVDRDTGFRVDDKPVGTWAIDESGTWGPQEVKKGAAYEFAFEHQAGGKHYFYREPFLTDNYFIRLNTSKPGTGIGILLTKTKEHTNILISRDKELWGDQGDNSDVLVVDGTSVLGSRAGVREKHLSGLFLLDWGYGGHPPFPPFNDEDFYSPHILGESYLDAPIEIFHNISFMSGLDLFMPAASPPDRTISIVLTPRGGGGAQQVINVPNWPSEEVRISVIFRDFVP